VSSSRTVIVGSALPLLILVGLVGFPPVRTAVGLERAEPVPQVGRASSAHSGRGSVAPSDRAATKEETIVLGRLRRSIRAGRDLAFTGTEVVSAWRPSGASTRVLDLVQRAGGVRTTTARDAGAQPVTALTATPDGLAVLSERALTALTAGYDLRSGGTDRVAGRAASVVVAARDGREVARMWLDERTGLLLRQDLLDSAGRPYRTAAFVDLKLTGAPAAAPVVTATPMPLNLPLRSSVRTVSRTVPSPAVGASVDPWDDVVSSAELTDLRADGWPCPAQLPVGFVLLDARRTEVTAGRSALHLTYGDGLSAISVFLQRGRLDGAQLAGLTPQKWGDADVYVRAGPPQVMVWQGGATVITVVGDVEPGDLQRALSALPRQPNGGTLDSLQQRMGSALAWFKG
jgi:sigma-E factor negative regulatory protein RseB